MNIKWVDRVEDVVPIEVDWSRAYTAEEADRLLDGATFFRGTSPEGFKKRMMMTPEEREILDCDRD